MKIHEILLLITHFNSSIISFVCVYSFCFFFCTDIP